MIKKQGSVTFYPDTHKYVDDDGGVYTSVTTFIKKYKPEFDADMISRREAVKRLGLGAALEAIVMEQYRVLLSWKIKGTLASERGTRIHELEETRLKGGNFVLGGNVFPYSESLIVGHAVPELIVYDRQLLLSGMVDLIVYDDNGLTIIDYKTNESIKTSNKWQRLLGAFSDLDDCEYEIYSLQLSLYKLLLERQYGVPVKGMMLYHLNGSTVNSLINTKDYSLRLKELLGF
jgi:hypothetical protein